MDYGVLWLLCCLLCSRCEENHSNRVAVNEGNSVCLRIISDPSVTPQKLRSAIRLLAGVQESSHFWARIANDPKYTVAHRRQCVVQLFKRHVRPNMTLQQIAQMLEGATWLKDGDLCYYSYLCGYVPVRGEIGSDSVYSLVPLIGKGSRDELEEDAGVYLSFPGKLREADLYRIFRGQKAEEKVKSLRILDSWPGAI